MKKILFTIALFSFFEFSFAEKEYIRFTFDPYSSGVTLQDGRTIVLHKDNDDISKPFKNYTEVLNHLAKEGWEFKTFMPDGSTLLEREVKKDSSKEDKKEEEQ